MNKIARMIVQDKLNRRDSAHDQTDRTSGRDYASGVREGYRDGYNDGYDRAKYEIRGEYDKESHEDGARRRSKTTGRYMRDRGEHLRLSDEDIRNWEKKLRNADGTKGKHFDMEQVEKEAHKLGIRFDEYSEKEFCMTMNMLYSDFCETFKPYYTPEKEAFEYAKKAQAWLEDDDGPPPAEKLALYYYCIVDNDE